MGTKPSNHAPSPALHKALRLLLIAALGLLAAVLWSSPLPLELYHLVHRGLRRHGFNFEFKIANREPLGLRHDNGRNPVSMTTGEEIVNLAFGEPFFRLFTSRDSNHDGYLSPEEFREFYRIVAPAEIPRPKARARTASGGGVKEVEVETLFEPLHIETLTKEMTGRSATNTGYLRSLLAWKRPNRRRFHVAVADLADLVWPSHARHLGVGKPYFILEGSRLDSRHRRAFPEFTNRYYLPAVFNSRRERLLHQLMSAFHPRAFPYTRYEPSGSAAVVKALSEHLVTVYFRFHVEFQLNEPPEYPFWFTPSYFIGEATMTRNLSSVLRFHLDIPKERKLNVDMEWLQLSPSLSPFATNVEVDIGYTPQMRLQLREPVSVEGVVWKKNISTNQAFRAVERRLYPFKKVEYFPFPKSFEEAARKDKLVHSVVLWGSLDDQSC